MYANLEEAEMYKDAQNTRLLDRAHNEDQFMEKTETALRNAAAWFVFNQSNLYCRKSSIVTFSIR